MPVQAKFNILKESIPLLSTCIMIFIIHDFLQYFKLSNNSIGFWFLDSSLLELLTVYRLSSDSSFVQAMSNLALWIYSGATILSVTFMILFISTCLFVSLEKKWAGLILLGKQIFFE